MGNACYGPVTCDPLNLVIGPLVLNELGNQVVPERVAGYELVYPSFVSEPLGPSLERGIRALEDRLITVYPVPGDVLLEQDQSGVIDEDLPALFIGCLPPSLLYVSPETLLPDVYVPGGDPLDLAHPPASPGQEPEEEVSGLIC